VARGGRWVLASLIASSSLLASPLAAQAADAGRGGRGGRGTVSVSLQAIGTSGAFLASGETTLPDSSSNGYAALLEVDYALDERWSLYVALPYVTKRFTGFPPHDPALLETPHPEARYIDDAEYHGGLQDWRLGLSYRLGGARWEASPFVRAELPSRDYPHFGSAAIGQNLWRVELGARFAHQLEFSNFYYGAGYSYTLVEETLGVNVDYHRVPVRVGYFLSPRFSVEVFGEGKIGNGRDGDDYECGRVGASGQCLFPRQDEWWYQHDRQLRHDYANVGLATTFALNDAYAVSLSSWEMVWGRSLNRLDYAVNVTVSRSF
jgi:hypothetical protein